MVKRAVILIYLQSIILSVFAGADTISPVTFNKKKLIIVGATNAAFYTGSFIVLNKAWYADYKRTGFHFFNDNPEWNQMDKAGHVWSAYHVSRLSNEMWKWTGLSNNTSAILGGVSGIIYEGIIEFQDAYSAEWGFSWGDIGANAAGAGLFVLQEMTGKQKITVKLGYSPKKYSSELIARRNQLFGDALTERILKDYNSQTYWLSANISSLFSGSGIPKWLNIALGYGAGGMYGGRSNVWMDKEGITHDYSDTRRIRRFFLSPDADLTKISTRSRVLKTMFFVLNMVKIPAPALEVSTGKGFKITIR